MVKRLTVETVRKAFGGYGTPPDWEESRKQKARAAIENYNIMLGKAQHAASDLSAALDNLLENIYNNNTDIDSTDTLEDRFEVARQCLATIIGLTEYEIHEEEQKL